MSVMTQGTSQSHVQSLLVGVTDLEGLRKTFRKGKSRCKSRIQRALPRHAGFKSPRGAQALDSTQDSTIAIIK